MAPDHEAGAKLRILTQGETKRPSPAYFRISDIRARKMVVKTDSTSASAGSVAPPRISRLAAAAPPFGRPARHPEPQENGTRPRGRCQVKDLDPGRNKKAKSRIFSYFRHSRKKNGR